MARRVKVKRVVPGPVCRVPDAARDGRRRRVRPLRFEVLDVFEGPLSARLSHEALPVRPGRS